jgi:hypothetical protein
MAEHFALMRLIEEPAHRRGWLLYRALECLPLDRAIDLARAADAFVTGPVSERLISNAAVGSEPAVGPSERYREQPYASEPDKQSGPETRATQKRAALALSIDQREQLFDRLAKGARNAELAAEFRISPRQVQGIRMGRARAIAKGRGDGNREERPVSHPSSVSTSMDDVVRYLRQQDDVVVPQGDDEFLVNARFRLPSAELISRANRMRVRQGKPEFELSGGQPRRAETVSSANGHPMFWREKASTQSGPEPASSSERMK